MMQYSFVVRWSDEDEEFMATCPEFPGLSAFGETPEEALREAQIALDGMIDVYRDKGIALPHPRKEEPYSRQFRVRIPKSLHRQAVEMAEAENISLNSLMIAAIAHFIGNRSGNSATKAARTGKK